MALDLRPPFMTQTFEEIVCESFESLTGHITNGQVMAELKKRMSVTEFEMWATKALAEAIDVVLEENFSTAPPTLRSI